MFAKKVISLHAKNCVYIGLHCCDKSICQLLLISKRVFATMCLVVVSSVLSHAMKPMYHCELGLQGGCGYYVGDASKIIFNNAREAYGLYFRYRFDQRWALKVNAGGQRIVGYQPDALGIVNKDKKLWTNQLVSADVLGEFNFFRFGPVQYDDRVKPITPYIALGLGCVLHNDFKKLTPYMSFALGMKWQVASRCMLTLAWQNNLCFGDNLENEPLYDNIHGLNGTNILNNDLIGGVMLGISVMFAPDKKVCRLCQL